MINQLTLHQLHTYIKDNVSACIVEDRLYNNRRVLYTIQIAGIQFSTSFSLYDILCNINADWNTAAINNIVDAFNTYILNRISDDDYKKLCNRLRLPLQIHNDRLKFDIVYLTDKDFEKRTFKDYNRTRIWKQVSNEELFKLCYIPLTDKPKS